MKTLVLASLAVATVTLPGRAQEPQLFPLASQVIVPQWRSFALRPGQVPVRIESVKAHVEILEQAATTTLEISLFNPGRNRAEAVLLLPVPEKAAIHSFLFDGPAREPTARLMKNDEARRLYDSIVRRVKDPALLEFAGYNLIRTSVFPVPGGGKQKVRLSYHHVLEADGDRVDYFLPRSESLEAKVPWQVSVEIRTHSPISTIYSPSHDIFFTREGKGRMRVRLKDPARLDPGPFRLSYLLERNGVSASLYAYPDPKVGGGYFLLLAGLPAKIAETKNPVKREVTIVLDRSGSMAGPKMDQVRAAALQVIEGLAEGEAFNIIDYSHTVELFSKKPVLKTRDAVLRARKYLASLRTTGGTNIHDALIEALRQERCGDRLPIVLFLTDGVPTVGQTSEVAIRTALEKGNPHHRRVFTFGVGTDVNVPLLDRLAELTRATSTYVLPEENVEVKVASVFQRLYGPVLADGALETLDKDGRVTTTAVRELIPATVPDLFQGDQLVLLGQYRGAGPLRFRLRGTYLGEAKEFKLTFSLDKASTRHAFVPRLWASRRIAHLIDQIRQMGAQTGAGPALVGQSKLDPRVRELVNEVLRLSTEFGILSEYTSFLAREGTDLSDWKTMYLLCNNEIETKAVKVRSGLAAVARGRNFERGKKQKKLNYTNEYESRDQTWVQIHGVRQVSDRALFHRGGRWIDGRLIAAQAGLRVDLTVTYGTPAYDQLLTGLIAEGRQAAIAQQGEILLIHDGKNILVKNDLEGTK